MKHLCFQKQGHIYVKDTLRTINYFNQLDIKNGLVNFVPYYVPKVSGWGGGERAAKVKKCTKFCYYFHLRLQFGKFQCYLHSI